MKNRDIAKQDQEFLDQIIRFIDVGAISKELKQKFTKKPFKVDLSSVLEIRMTELEKFSLMLELKITIPADYQHVGHLGRFCENNKEKFYFYNDNITDKQFNIVDHKLIPGKTYLVKIWSINEGKGRFSDAQDILTLLEVNNAYLTGAHGASLLWQEKRNELPKDMEYISMDRWRNLPRVRDVFSLPNIVVMPNIFVNPKGDFGFGLNYFDGSLRDNCCAIGFCDCDCEDSAD